MVAKQPHGSMVLLQLDSHVMKSAMELHLILQSERSSAEQLAQREELYSEERSWLRRKKLGQSEEAASERRRWLRGKKLAQKEEAGSEGRSWLRGKKEAGSEGRS